MINQVIIMKKILLLAVLIFGAHSFAAEKKEARIGEINKHPCFLGDRDDEKCKNNSIHEYGSNKDLNCGLVLSHSQCNVIPADSQAFDICCRIPAQGKITKCKMTPDKQMLFCEDASSGKELVYTLISNQGFIPISNPSYSQRRDNKELEGETDRIPKFIDSDKK